MVYSDSLVKWLVEDVMNCVGLHFPCMLLMRAISENVSKKEHFVPVEQLTEIATSTSNKLHL